MGESTAEDSVELKEICPRKTRKTRKRAEKNVRRKIINPSNTDLFKFKKTFALNFSRPFAYFAGNKNIMTDIIYKEESYKIIGACFEVYKQKGCGFTEGVYQECLAIEFEIQNISFIAQPRIELEYKGRKLEQFFVPDFICFDKIIVEIKALSNLIEVNKAQTLNYLNATKYDLALLVNFGHFPQLEYKRIANNQPKTNNNNSLKEEIKSWL